MVANPGHGGLMWPEDVDCDCRLLVHAVGALLEHYFSALPPVSRTGEVDVLAMGTGAAAAVMMCVARNSFRVGAVVLLNPQWRVEGVSAEVVGGMVSALPLADSVGGEASRLMAYYGHFFYSEAFRASLGGPAFLARVSDPCSSAGVASLLRGALAKSPVPPHLEDFFSRHRVVVIRSKENRLDPTPAGPPAGARRFATVQEMVSSEPGLPDSGGVVELEIPGGRTIFEAKEVVVDVLGALSKRKRFFLPSETSESATETQSEARETNVTS